MYPKATPVEWYPFQGWFQGATAIRLQPPFWEPSGFVFLGVGAADEHGINPKNGSPQMEVVGGGRVGCWTIVGASTLVSRDQKENHPLWGPNPYLQTYQDFLESVLLFCGLLSSETKVSVVVLQEIYAAGRDIAF